MGMMTGMGRKAGIAPLKSRAGLRMRRLLAAIASSAAVLPSSPAFSLQVEGHEAFIVDRCGGDYDCKDVKLVVLNDKHDKADIYSGNEVNGHEADGTASHVSGYAFKYNGGNLSLSQDGTPSQLNGKPTEVKFNNGVAFESDKNYVYIYSTCNADGATSVAGITTSCDLNYIGVDKKTSNAIQIGGHYTPLAATPAGGADLCKAGVMAGQFSFLNNGYEYRLTSDLCPAGKSTLAIVSNNVVKSSFDLQVRPLAGSN
ncbi:hypothetical protein [Rhizobium leucaenae]|uniref:Uncharacterized protein n=1 Tax=Rhizobium leucaenae TaxID=29450 RepID=A0A7W6ZUR5_9HYPH|nr:hypothetical protein [Rhizobium leucaenae]MBB4569107.1 hypothetical protein [Rhizobium leucaenae]MBB6300024.1 hypothetical protein [Rhizobium leucaenae]